MKQTPPVAHVASKPDLRPPSLSPPKRPCKRSGDRQVAAARAAVRVMSARLDHGAKPRKI
jgi:hypothetical protein